MSTAIPESAAETIVRTCRTAVGDQLRSVTYFTVDEYEHLYLRDDLERGDDPLSFVTTERQGFASQQTYEWSELGEYRYNMRVFEKGYVVRVIAGDRGVYVTTGPLTMDRFNELGEALSNVLAEM